MVPPTRYAAVLSDLDGVLVDSGSSIERSWARWAHGHGIDPGVLLGQVHGRPTREVIALVAPHLDVAAEVERLEGMEIESASATALPGAAALLSGASGMPVAIVTSCTAPLAHARLSALGLKVPEVLITVDRVRAGKPDPEGYLIAAAELGVAAADCVVLEDAPAGIAAGRAAGATVIAIATTHAHDDLRDAHAIHASIAEALSLT